MLQELTERETESAAFSDSHGMKAAAEAYGLTINQVDNIRRKRRKRAKALEKGAADAAGLVEIKGRGGKMDKMDPTKYERKKDAFGSVTFKPNLDLTLKEVYDHYALRRQIELVFRMYKGILSMNASRAHDDPSLIGTEFIDFLSVVMTCRMKNRLNQLGCLKNDSFGNILEGLSNITKTSADGKEWRLCALNAKEKDLLEKLGI